MINHIKKIYLPYTVIDVGMWYQIAIPRLPSGKIDYALTYSSDQVADDGQRASSITDLRDIGRYVARIITDERTLNQYVFTYNEVWTQNQIWNHLEKISGEKIPRSPVSQTVIQVLFAIMLIQLQISREEIEATIAAAQAKYDGGDKSYQDLLGFVVPQYFYSEWHREDNLPERAKYLGYLTTKDLYPDFEYTKFETYLDELVKGAGVPVYAKSD